MVRTGNIKVAAKKMNMILYPLLEALGVPDMLSSLLVKDCLTHSSRTKTGSMRNPTRVFLMRNCTFFTSNVHLAR
jgi:hypothetical protein